MPEDHSARLTSQHELARAYLENGQHRQAIKIPEHLVTVREKIDGDDSPDLLELQRQLASAKLSADRFEEGNNLREHIKNVKGKSSSDEHPEQKD